MFLNRQKKDVVNSKGPQSSSAKSQGRHSRWGKGFYLHFLGSKITVDGDCSHEIKRHLLLGRKAMTNLDSMLKSRDITLPTKVHLVKVMYECESWTKAAENWCFWTVVLEKTLETPLDCEEITPVHPKRNQSWVFIGRTVLKVKLSTLATWCKELTRLKRPWCWERLKAGEEMYDRAWDGWMASPTA